MKHLKRLVAYLALFCAGTAVMAQGVTLGLAESEQYGSYLVDAEGRSLYLFLNDDTDTSNCAEQCAQNWPPLLSEGEASAGEGIDAERIGAIERADGGTQVTYNGWPLYTFADDANPGDAAGQGRGGVWYLVSPLGSLVVMGIQPAQDAPADTATTQEADAAGEESEATDTPTTDTPITDTTQDATQDTAEEEAAGAADEQAGDAPETEAEQEGVAQETPATPTEPAEAQEDEAQDAQTEPTDAPGEQATPTEPVEEPETEPAGEPEGQEAETQPGETEEQDAQTEPAPAQEGETQNTQTDAQTPEGQTGETQEDETEAAAQEPMGEMALGLELAESEEYGPYLVDAQGRALYLFLNDSESISACYEQCAQNWPPLLAEGEPTVGDGLDAALLGTTERNDGTQQVTYGGWPLYTFANDANAGEVNGQGRGEVWYLVTPEGEQVGMMAQAPSEAQEQQEAATQEEAETQEQEAETQPETEGQEQQESEESETQEETETQEAETAAEPQGEAMQDMMAQNGVGFELVAEGFSSPVHLASPEGDSRRFVVDRVGYIYILDETGERLEEPFLDLSSDIVELREAFDERGVLGLAFHPEFADNGRFYVYYSVPLRESAPQDWDHTSRISEFRVAEGDDAEEGDPNQADPDSERILLEVDQPQFNHNGGSLDFGPDGYLYIALGDGGAADDVALGHPPIGHGQDTTSLLGNILRLDVDRGWPGYAIPEDNPFAGNEVQGHPEIYAWGWRNPWRMSFDRGGDNHLYVATNGQNLWEAVYEVDEPGNYGWNLLEGTHCFDPDSPDEAPEECERTGRLGEELQEPVIEYPHLVNQGESDVAGISVIGGYVYRGAALPELEGNYIFGDWSLSFGEPQGQVLMATPGAGEGELWALERVAQLESYVLGFGEDSDGELYVLTTNETGPLGETGGVYRIVAASEAQDAPETQQEEQETSEPQDQQTQEEQEGEQDDQQQDDQDPQQDDQQEDEQQDEQEDDGQTDVETTPGEETGATAFFTVSQAEAGRAAYEENCQECHAGNLQSVDPFPPLTGPRFFATWEGRSAQELYDYTHENMPLDAPGSLSDETYLDIMAFWLEFHGYPAGDAELSQAALEQIAIEPRSEE